MNNYLQSLDFLKSSGALEGREYNLCWPIMKQASNLNLMGFLFGALGALAASGGNEYYAANFCEQGVQLFSADSKYKVLGTNGPAFKWQQIKQIKPVFGLNGFRMRFTYASGDTVVYNAVVNKKVENDYKMLTAILDLICAKYPQNEKTLKKSEKFKAKLLKKAQ